MSRPTLENGVEFNTLKFLEALNSSGGPGLETLSPADARKVLEGAQKGVELPPAIVEKKTITVDGKPLLLYVVRPEGTEGGAGGKTLPGFIFIHGGGWVLGDFPTHERYVRDLVRYSGAVAVFVEYDRSPEAKYPTAIHQAYGAAKWVAEHGKEIGVDSSRLGIVGNSVGGNMVAAVTLLAKKHGGPKFAVQVLHWPVTDANFDTASYNQYETGHFLTRPMMKWFWDAYTTNPQQRNEITASPLRATLEDLKGLPPALIQTAGHDVLRDEGEAYARKLNAAGVTVQSIRYNGLIHDFGLLNPLSKIPAVQDALELTGVTLRRYLF